MCHYRKYRFSCDHCYTVRLSVCNARIRRTWGEPACRSIGADITIKLQAICSRCIVKIDKKILGRRRRMVEDVLQDMIKALAKQIAQKHARSSEYVSLDSESGFWGLLDDVGEERENILLEEDRLARSEARRKEILRDKRQRRLIGKDGRLEPRAMSRATPGTMRGSLLRFEVEADETVRPGVAWSFRSA